MVQAERRLTTGRTGSGGGATRRRARRLALLLTFLLPALVLYTVFIIYPLVSALQYSLFSWNGLQQGGFAGVSNFVDLFTKYPLSEQVPRALLHNCIFFVGTMLIQTTAGLLLAVLLHRSRRGKRFLQTAYILPHLVSPIVAGYLWSMMLNPQFGAVNAALKGIGLGSLAQPWRGDPHLALPVAIVVNAWQWVGFPMLLFAAALAGIPEEYHEAARVDGASAWTSFRRVTFPLLTPVLGIVTVLTFIGNFNILDLIYALQGSKGNPSFSTDVLGLLFYRTAFESPDANSIGQSSALAVLMFALIFGVSIVANRFFRRMEARLK